MPANRPDSAEVFFRDRSPAADRLALAIQRAHVQSNVLTLALGRGIKCLTGRLARLDRLCPANTLGIRTAELRRVLIREFELLRRRGRLMLKRMNVTHAGETWRTSLRRGYTQYRQDPIKPSAVRIGRMRRQRPYDDRQRESGKLTSSDKQ